MCYCLRATIRQAEYSEQIVQFSTLSFHMFRRFPPQEIRLPKKLVMYAKIIQVGRDLKSQPLKFQNWTDESFRYYGCYQSLMKMHPRFDQVIVQILKIDPQAVIILSRNSKQPVWQTMFQDRLLNVLISQEADWRRIVLLDQVID